MSMKNRLNLACAALAVLATTIAVRGEQHERRGGTMKKFTWVAVLAISLILVCCDAALAASSFDDFAANPNIGTQWTTYNYYNSPTAPVWDSTDKDLDLVNYTALYRTGTTRAATDPVTMTVKVLNRSGGSWGFLGLMISAVAQPGYVSTADDTYTLAMVTLSATTFRYEVRRTYLDGTGNYQLYIGPTITFAGPYTNTISRVGDHYEFRSNGTLLYTTASPAAGDTYTLAAKNAMVYYEIVMAGDGAITATVDNFGVPINDTTPPTIATLSPTNNATGVAGYANLSATFNESIQMGTGNITLKKGADNSTIETFDVATSSRITVSGATLTIDPTSVLAGLTGYYVQIDTNAVKDLANNAFAGITDTTTWTFTTGVADTTAPSLSTLSPADDATDVAVAANLVATFDETIQKGTGNITLKKIADNSTIETFDVATSPRITVSGATLTIDPTSNLAAATGYYVEIASTAIQDLSENAFAGFSGATAWNFTTVMLPTDYTWINTSSGASGYWTNSANWVGGTYPRPAAGDSAFMTNTIASGAYRNILDTTLGGTLTALKISNSGAGQACLIVSNATLNVNTFTLGSGGVLEIAENGAVTNNATANTNWWTGNSGTIQLNGGGKYVTTNAVTLGASLSNVKATVGTTGASGGSWDLAAKALTLGGGSGTITNNMLLVAGSGVVVTNVGITGGRSGAYNGLTLGTYSTSSSGNSLIISNGAKVAVNSGWALTDLDSSGNRILVDNGTLTAPAYIIGWAHSGPAYGLNNTLTVTNGGTVTATGTSGLALGNGGPGLSGYGSSSNTVIVAGTNSSGAKATISLNGGALWIGNAAGSGGTRAANSNLVLIGNGGIITNAGAVTVGVGSSSTGNSLILTNGGQLFSTNTSSIGNGGDNNTALVMGGGGGTSFWSLGNQTLNVGAGGGIGNVLRVDGAGVTGGAVVANGGLFVGSGGSRNSVLVTNGAQVVFVNDSRVGYASGGSVLSNILSIVNATYTGGSNRFHVGWAETGGTAAYNQLYVGAGGLMTNVGYTATLNEIDFTVGAVATATAYSNQMVVTDGGKVFTLGNLAVGRIFNYAGSSSSVASSNSLLIANGGLVNVPGGFFLGADSTASGYNAFGTASFNSLTITNGGQLITATNSYIGLANTSGSVMNNNTATIGGSLNGTNATWNLGGRNLTLGSAVGGATATGNVLTVSSGGVVTNVGSLTISATNTLSMLAGGQIYANAATNAGTLTVGLNDSLAPACGRLTVSGSLNITGATLNLAFTGSTAGTHILAKYGTLTGTFAAINGLPAGGRVDYAYAGGTQIAVRVPQGTMISFF